MPYANPPLVEAIFEVKWKLNQANSNSPPTDPYHSMALGHFKHLASEAGFGWWEQLVGDDVPVFLMPHAARQRFRVAEGKWPLFQLGPGVMTVNQTAGYAWDDFQKHCVKAVECLTTAYSDSPVPLKPQQYALRYIDSDITNGEPFVEFLREKMGVDIRIPEQAKERCDLAGEAIKTSLSMGFPLQSELGEAVFVFNSGTKNKEPAIVWETRIVKASEDIPPLKSVPEWLEKARKVANSWFDVIVEKELKEGYGEHT